MSQRPDSISQSWPEPLRQRGLSCQTVAIINGIRCYQAVDQKPVWDPSASNIDAIRIAATYREKDRPLMASTADAVARFFVDKGVLRAALMKHEPIAAAAFMACERGFAVITHGGETPERAHAVTVIPNLGGLATSIGSIPELITIDSITGTQTEISVEEFCVTMLTQEPSLGDQTLVCTVNH